MSELFDATYQGRAGVGYATVFVGKGSILGIEGPFARFNCTYKEKCGRLKGTLFHNGGRNVRQARYRSRVATRLFAHGPVRFASGLG